jgi:hypothetical protein
MADRAGTSDIDSLAREVSGGISIRAGLAAGE